MRRLILTTAVLLGGCATTRAAVEKPPVLGVVSDRDVKAEFKGGDYDPKGLFVCGTITTGTLTCMPYGLFMQQLFADRPADPSI